MSSITYLERVKIEALCCLKLSQAENERKRIVELQQQGMAIVKRQGKYYEQKIPI